MTNDHKGSRGCVNVNKSASRNECANVPVETGPGTFANIAITLADITVTDHLVAEIHFPDPVLEIKDIKKRVKIVQCRLLLGPDSDPDLGIPLFIKGFIRKNIQYATPCPHATSDCVSSELRSLTVDVPFECVTILTGDTFITDPVNPQANTRVEFDFFRAQKLGHGFPEKDHLLSSDLSQFHQASTQFYNQLPFCELVRSDILQWDEAIDRYPLPHNGPFEEGTFQTIVEKTFLQFQVRVLQTQQRRISDLI